ncbi:MAG: hypothetical protein FJZ49_05635 [Candidatus Verstraetearchaeota archaeon]|nr:hypothetical protein [Candidatus Verstraetearchaeota archaeon]
MISSKLYEKIVASMPIASVEAIVKGDSLLMMRRKTAPPRGEGGRGGGGGGGGGSLAGRLEEAKPSREHYSAR